MNAPVSSEISQLPRNFWQLWGRSLSPSLARDNAVALFVGTAVVIPEEVSAWWQLVVPFFSIFSPWGVRLSSIGIALMMLVKPSICDFASSISIATALASEEEWGKGSMFSLLCTVKPKTSHVQKKVCTCWGLANSDLHKKNIRLHTVTISAKERPDSIHDRTKIRLNLFWFSTMVVMGSQPENDGTGAVFFSGRLNPEQLDKVRKAVLFGSNTNLKARRLTPGQLWNDLSSEPCCY